MPTQRHLLLVATEERDPACVPFDPMLVSGLLARGHEVLVAPVASLVWDSRQSLPSVRAVRLGAAETSAVGDVMLTALDALHFRRAEGADARPLLAAAHLLAPLAERTAFFNNPAALADWSWHDVDPGHGPVHHSVFVLGRTLHHWWQSVDHDLDFFSGETSGVAETRPYEPWDEEVRAAERVAEELARSGLVVARLDWAAGRLCAVDVGDPRLPPLTPHHGVLSQRMALWYELACRRRGLRLIEREG